MRIIRLLLFLFGRTFAMRCGWIREVRRMVRQGKIPASYQRTVDNLIAAFSWRPLGARHAIRFRKGFSPVQLLVEITNWCPNRCSYCYNESGADGCEPQFMDLDRLERILDEVREAFRIRFAVITGGEPFPYVLQLAKRRPDFTFFTYTSGNIKPWICEEMVKLGNVVPAITIVDTDPAVHDAVRGPGSFERVMAARDYLREYRLPWGWSLTSSRVNYAHIVRGNLLEELAAMEPFLIRAMPWMPVGHADAEFVLTPKQMAEIGGKIREAQQGGVRVFDYISAPEGYPCLAGGQRSVFIGLDKGNQGEMIVSPCVFMRDAVSVPLGFRPDGSSTLFEILRNDPWFANARALARRHQCIIHENRGNWADLIKEGWQSFRAAA